MSSPVAFCSHCLSTIFSSTTGLSAPSCHVRGVLIVMFLFGKATCGRALCEK